MDADQRRADPDQKHLFEDILEIFVLIMIVSL